MASEYSSYVKGEYYVKISVLNLLRKHVKLNLKNMIKHDITYDHFNSCKHITESIYK